MDSSTRFDTDTPSNVISRSFGWSRSAPRARATAISVRVNVAEIGAVNVIERATNRIPGKWTRTVTVRPAHSDARRRDATRSHR